jgi:hypothetical protein
MRAPDLGDRLDASPDRASRPSCATVYEPCPVEACRRVDVVDAPLRQRTCRRCNRLFAICISCDRGHAYCSPACREAARSASVRAARQRHRRSPEGRLDHRDHQRAYRARVRDHTSQRAAALATLPVDTATGLVPTAPLAGALRCMVCGRDSAWLLPPPWRIRRVSAETTRDDHARTARRDPAALLRRALEGRHHRRGPRRPP